MVKTTVTGRFSATTATRTKLTAESRGNNNKRNTIERTETLKESIKVTIEPAVQTTAKRTGKFRMGTFSKATIDVTEILYNNS